MKAIIEVTVIMEVESWLPDSTPRDHVQREMERAALDSVKLDTVAGVDAVTKYISKARMR